MPQYIVYQYDPETGFINATNSSSWDEDHPYLQTPNFLPSEEPLKDKDGNMIGGGWSFTLVNGKPSKDADGNYIVTPPPPYIAPLTVNDHVFIAMVKSGQIDIKDVQADVLSNLNKSLQAAGLPTLGG